MADLNLGRVTWRSTGRSSTDGVRLSFHQANGSILRLELSRACALTVADTIDDHLRQADEGSPASSAEASPEAPAHG